MPLTPFDGDQILMPCVEMLGGQTARIYESGSTVIALLFVAAVLFGDLWNLKKPSPKLARRDIALNHPFDRGGFFIPVGIGRWRGGKAFFGSRDRLNGY